MNMYAYVGGDPINRTDPSGLDYIDGVDDYTSICDGGGCTGGTSFGNPRADDGPTFELTYEFEDKSTYRTNASQEDAEWVLERAATEGVPIIIGGLELTFPEMLGTGALDWLDLPNLTRAMATYESPDGRRTYDTQRVPVKIFFRGPDHMNGLNGRYIPDRDPTGMIIGGSIELLHPERRGGDVAGVNLTLAHELAHAIDNQFLSKRERDDQDSDMHEDHIREWERSVRGFFYGDDI